MRTRIDGIFLKMVNQVIEPTTFHPAKSEAFRGDIEIFVSDSVGAREEAKHEVARMLCVHTKAIGHVLHSRFLLFVLKFHVHLCLVAREKLTIFDYRLCV